MGGTAQRSGTAAPTVADLTAAVDRVADVLAESHPGLPADEIRQIVYHAANELAGSAYSDRFGQMLHRRCDARLNAIVGRFTPVRSTLGRSVLTDSP